MPVRFRELLDGFELSSFAGLQSEVIVCRQTGRIYWRSDDLDLEELEELPEDIDDEEKYLSVPDRKELGLGKPLVLDFARELLPDDLVDIRYMFAKRGAYAKFKALLMRRNACQHWYDFEAKATERALRAWCADNELEITD